MQLVKIDENNRKYFEHILFDGETEAHELGVQIGIVDENIPAGAVSMVFDLPFCYITSIYVIPEKRRQGLGRKLLEVCERFAEDVGALRIDVNYTIDAPGLNDLLVGLDYISRKEQKVYEFTTEELLSSDFVAQCKKQKDMGAMFMPYDSMSDEEKTKLYKSLMKEGVEFSDSRYKSFDGKLSGVAMDKNGEIYSALICTSDGDRVNVNLLQGFKDSTKGVIAVLLGFLFMLKKDGKTVVTMLPVNDSVFRLIKRIAGDMEPRTVTESVYSYKVL